MTEQKLPVVTDVTLGALLEAMSDSDLEFLKSGSLNMESSTGVMKRENPLLFSRLEKFAETQPLPVQARIFYAGTMVYMALRAQLAADNVMPKSS